jgi:hypothetical protein
VGAASSWHVSGSISGTVFSQVGVVAEDGEKGGDISHASRSALNRGPESKVVGSVARQSTAEEEEEQEWA